MNETTTAPVRDKATLRSELESTHAAYRELIGQISLEKWTAQSANAGWTCGQLAWHLASSPKFIAGIVENARKGKGTNPPGFLVPLAFKANEFLVRRNSRKATRESVLADYDAAQARLLGLLDSFEDREFALSATNFGQTKTISQMLQGSAEHFAEHDPEIRSVL